MLLLLLGSDIGTRGLSGSNILLVFREAEREEMQNRVLRAERPQAMGSLIWDLLKAGWLMKMIRAVDPRFFTLRETRS